MQCMKAPCGARTHTQGKMAVFTAYTSVLLYYRVAAWNEQAGPFSLSICELFYHGLLEYSRDSDTRIDIDPW